MSDSKKSEVLLELTNNHLDTGLRGIPVGHCSTSMVDPVKGLAYRGYYIQELMDKSSEEIIYLLFNGELPKNDSSEWMDFKNKLSSYSLDYRMVDHFKSLPKEGHPMKWFLSGLNYMGMVQGKNDWKEDTLQVIALIPEMVAMLYRIRSGWGDPIASNPKLGYMANFNHMLSVPNSKPGLEEFLSAFNILHFDHGGGNLSTFTGKVIASGEADMYESLVGAMAGLAGPLHGKANQKALAFIEKIHSDLDDPTDEDKIEAYLRDLLAKGGKIFGFGHAVLRVEDPRATVQFELGKKLIKNDPLFNMALKLRKIGVKILSEMEKVTNPYPNVDAVSGSLLHGLGLNDSSYYTVLFGMSRCVGIACQIYFERALARGGKGISITRPKYIYNGPTR